MTNRTKTKTKLSTPPYLLKIGVLLVCLGSFLNQGMARADSNYRSPSHIIASPDGKNLFVTETTAASVAELNAQTGKLIRRYQSTQDPTGLVLSPDGKGLFVTAGISRGQVIVFDTESGRKLRTFDVGHSPTAPVLSKDGKTLFVCNRFSNQVSIIDTASGYIRATVPVKREPVSAILTEDGAHLLVVNHLPAGAANDDYVAASISVIDAKTYKVSSELTLPNGSNGLRDICLSPNGMFAYVGHVLARYQVPAAQLERGWINTNAVSVFDLEKMEHFKTFLLDDIDLGAPNPWGVAVSEDSNTLAVTHAGSHEMSLIDLYALHKKLLAASADQIQNDLNFVAGIRKRVKLTGKNPRSCTSTGSRVFIAQFFSDDVGVVDFSDAAHPAISSFPLGPDKKMDEVRRGRFLFNDGSFCFQQWQSCASCHPSERVDALNWDILNDGIGNPKNTKSLLHSHKTPPTTATGCRPNAETSVRAGIRFFAAVLPESDALAIDAFLKSMEAVPSPYLVNGKFSESARRGKAIFEKAKCNECHSGDYYTDLRLHDVGTGEGYEFGTEFDVPTLIEVWRTAPYLYDGRARTMREVVTTENADDKHGHTKNLTDNEIKDLTEYVLSL